MRAQRWIYGTAWSGLVLMGVLVVVPVDAQRGGGRGGGGDGVSRSGAASSGNWQANRSSMQESRQASGQQRQESREASAQQRQTGRQSTAQDMQENRQEWADDYHGHGYGGYYRPGGAYAAGAVAGVVVGATITAAAFSAMAVPPAPVVVSGVTYYQSGSTWYQPMYQGGQVTYVVVNPPQ
jgi:hypothetical protein